MEKIFCVEDDSSIRDMMLYTLNASGFAASGFENANEFWKQIKEEKPQLVILDIMLPDEDGISILKKLRADPEYAAIPVIMATAKGTEYDKVIGLDLGADDYLVKPFGMMEMISRIRAVLRRTMPKEEKNILRIGRLELDKSRHIVNVDGERVDLTLKEYELLRLFMEHPGKAFTRDEILSIVWKSDYAGETRTVDVHIGTLRTKIEKYGDLIKTVRGVGYRLEASL